MNGTGVEQRAVRWLRLGLHTVWLRTKRLAAPFKLALQLVVGSKRSRADFEGDVEIQPVKKVRTGNGARQWITVYNKHAPMKQR